LIKYIKSFLWRVAKCLSYIEEARCLKVNVNFNTPFKTFSCASVGNKTDNIYALSMSIFSSCFWPDGCEQFLQEYNFNCTK